MKAEAEGNLVEQQLKERHLEERHLKEGGWLAEKVQMGQLQRKGKLSWQN